MRHEDAEREYRTALQFDPDHTATYYNLGAELMKERRDGEGIAALNEYLKRSPQGPNAKAARELIDNPRRARENFVSADFALVTKDGEYVTPEDVKGKVVLLDFWASWCKPCEASLPTLQRLSKRYGKDQFLLISISVDQNEQAWQQFLSSHRMDWPQALDRDFKLRRMFNVQPIPTYVLVDAEGIMRSYVIGSGIDSVAQLEDAVKKSFKNTPKPEKALAVKTQPEPATPPPSAPVLPAATAAPAETSTAREAVPSAKPATSANALPNAAPAAGATRPSLSQPIDSPESLLVTSNPDGAEIYLDQNFIGNAPATLRLAAGRHYIRLTLRGYRPWANEVTAQLGSEARLTATLVKSIPVTVHGRVLWNEQPVAGVPVYVRECSAATPRYGPATTDPQGNYTLSGVPDGRICIDPRPPNVQEFWTASVASFEALPGIEATAPDAYICKLFRPISPRPGEPVSQVRPTLKWNPFPDAASYGVQVWRFSPERRYMSVFSRGGERNRDDRIEATSVQVDVDMSPGEYFWRVDAYNRAGHVTGCNLPIRFTVTQAGSNSGLSR